MGNLSDYAVEVRYPDVFYMPSRVEAEESIAIANIIKDFVFRKLDIDEKNLQNNGVAPIKK